MAFCSKCGSKVFEDEKFCSSCGVKIEELLDDKIENTEQKEFVFSDPTMGGKAIIRLGDGVLTISRPGIMAKFSHGFSGDKTIMFNQISAVQIKKAGMTRGYIQFIMAGSREAKSGAIFGDSKDENIIYFSSGFDNTRVNAAAEEIKKAIEQYNKNSNKSTTNIVKQDDKYDKLSKLKKLLDDNVISQKEFDDEKKKILVE